MSTRHLGRCLVVVIALSVALGAGPASAQQASRERARELIAQVKAQSGEAGGVFQEALSGQAVPRGPVVDLTLDQAVKLATDQNLEIRIERINPRLQDLSVAQIRTGFGPSLTSTVGSRSQTRTPTSQLVGTTPIVNDTITYNGGFNQVLPWLGSSVGVTFTNSKLTSTDQFSNFNPQFNSALTATLTQPLLRNFRIDSTRQQLQTAQLSQEIADTQLRQVTATTLADVRNAYWDLVYWIQALEVAHRSLTLAEKLVEDNKIRVEVGALAKIDIVQAEAEAASRRQTLASIEASQKTAELSLKQLIVSATNDPLWTSTINPVDRPTYKPGTIDLEAAVQRALDRRTDLVQARRQMASNDVTLRYIRNQRLPAVDLTASYGLQGLGGTRFTRSGLGGSVTAVFPGGYKDALKNVQNREYPVWNLSVSVTYPIGSSSADIQHARARLQVDQNRAQIQALELQVAAEVTNAALQVESTAKRVDAATAARTLAERRLEAEQAKYEVGMQTNFFVVQAQRDLRDALNTELRAMLDYQKSRVTFERVQEASTSRTTPVSAISATGAGSARTTGSGSFGGQ